jgi:hypothetical protein
MPLDPQLRLAYERAQYVIFASPGVEFRIGQPSDVLDAIMTMNRVRHAAFVSSADAQGMPSDENRRRLDDFLLRAETAGLAYRVYQGEGRDPQGQWRAEPSLLILGIPREDAEALGRRLAQNAIVYIEKGQLPELVVLV